MKKKYFLIVLLAVLFLVNGAWGALFSLRPSIERELLPAQIEPESGYAYQAHFPNLNWIYSFKGDDSVNPYKSNLLLYEDEELLGTTHALHEVVRTEGKGAYSHWGKTLYFSASDNSDPRTNGKKYRVRVRPGLRFTITGSFLIVNFLTLALLVWVILRGGMISSIALSGFVGAFLIGIFFYFNLVSVTHWVGRSFYFLLGWILIFAALFLLFLEVRTSQKYVSFMKLVRRIQLGIVVLIFSLLALESWCRVVPIVDTLAVNPGCRFFWPDWYKYELNQYGYREREIPQKDESTYRILIYGDSYTEGAGVSRKNLAGVQLEKMLNAQLAQKNLEMRVEAYNLGHCGANTCQEAVWVENDYDELKPDLVILNYVLNDAENSIPTLLSTESKFARFLSAHLTGDHGSYLYYRWLRESPRFFPAGNSDKYSGRNYIEVIHDDAEPGWIAAQKAFRDLQSFLKERDTDVFAVIQPLFTPSVSPEMGEVMAKVSEAMEREGLESYNLLDYFMEESGGHLLKLAYSRVDSHPNALAHQKLAEFLSEVIWQRKSFSEEVLLEESEES